MLARQSQKREPEAENPDLVLLNDELNRLPQRYRVALILHHLEGLTESEAAKRVGCAVGTLSGRLSRGRQILRQRIGARSRAATAGALSTAAIAALFANQARASVVPAGFEESVSRPAALLAAGQSAARAHISARAAALTEGAIRMLFFARLRLAAALVLLAVIIATGVALTARHSLGQGNNRAAAQSGDLIGKLVDPRDQPVTGATIRLYANREQAKSNARPLAVVQSNDDGTFKLTELPPAKGYFLLCFKAQPTFMHAEVDPVEVVSSQAKDLGVIRMIEGRY